MTRLPPGGGYKRRARNFKPSHSRCSHVLLRLQKDATVITRANGRAGRPTRCSTLAQDWRLFGFIEPPPYAATQKKAWAEQKNAYLVLTRASASHWTGINVMANSTPITIKKYANRRLYNTASSAYVTLADLAKMVKAGEDFIVYDAKTNEDITRSVLTQIIFEQEGIEGQSLLPTTFLRQLIRFYGDSMQAILPSYLEFSIDRFSGEQQAMREAASRMFGPEAFSAGSFAALQELTKKNFAAFNQALAMFSPFAPATPATDLAPKKANSEDDIGQLRDQLSEMQKRLETLAKKS
jgi:polyhydroxyalkanoate synthesis repressor PhaR